MAASVNPLITGSAGVTADRSEPNWKVALRTIGQIALQILLSLAAVYLLYLTIPATIAPIALPIAAVCTTFVIFFLCAGQGNFLVARPEAPLPPSAPRGIRNGVMNCWMNSLAQTIRCDEGLKEWFLHLPNEWDRIRQIPLLPPGIFSRISQNNAAMPADLNLIFGQGAPPEQYLRDYHPKLQDPDIARAKSYYRKHCGNFQGTNEQFLQLLQNPQLAADLFQLDRQKIGTYFRLVGEVPNASRYFHFFAEIPGDERLDRWNALRAFQEFLDAYDRAENDNLREVPFSSQNLRLALHQLKPFSIGANPGSQEDPMEGYAAIGDLLTPNDLKVLIEMRKVYACGENPRMEGGEIIVKREGLQSGYMQLSITRENGIIQEMVDEWTSQRNENPELLVRQRGVDGETHNYLVDREEMQFVTAPPTLWLHVKRMHKVLVSSCECLSLLMPCWFPKTIERLQKLETPLIIQPVLKIQPLEGDEANYQLDSFIVHRGSTLQSGHYVSYRCVEVAPGNRVWFEMNDSRVRQLSDAEVDQFAKQAYAFHYTVRN
jgi:hypothetical protein